MADLGLAPAGSLDGIATAGRHGREGEAGVVLGVEPACRQTLVLARRGQDDRLVAACKTRGLTLPAPGRVTVTRDLTLVATGPGQWLALDRAFHTDLTGQLFTPVSEACSLIGVDDARTLLTIGGPAAGRALAKLLTIDLHPRAFAPGSAAITTAAGIAVTLWQVDATPRYVMAVPRSMVRTLWHWLIEAAAEHGLEVAGAPAQAPS